MDSVTSVPLVVMLHDYPPMSGGGLALATKDLQHLLAEQFDIRIGSSRVTDHFADDRDRLTERSSVTVSLLRLLRWAWHADVIVVHWTFSFRWLASLAIAFGPLTRRPVVAVVHTAPEHCEYNRLRRFPRALRAVLLRFAGIALRRCTATVALSPTHAIEMAAVGIDATHVLPLPVLMTQAAAGHATRGRVTVGFAGELSVIKGADQLPALFAAMNSRCHLRIAGHGPLASRLRSASADPSVTHVELLGSVTPHDMPKFYASLDYLLILSRTEAHCRVALEAMQAGVIVIARPVGGLRDLIIDGVTGFTIDPDQPSALGELLDRLHREPPVCERIRHEARRRAVTALETSTGGWLEMLAEMAALTR